MLNAQARSVRGGAFGVSNRQWRCRSARRRYPRQPRMSMLPGKGLFGPTQGLGPHGEFRLGRAVAFERPDTRAGRKRVGHLRHFCVISDRRW
jgi:hypothetical protein